MMWDVQRIHGSSGKNAAIIKAGAHPLLAWSIDLVSLLIIPYNTLIIGPITQVTK